MSPFFIIGFIVISLLGVLLHFLYELTNRNQYVAYFSAVNESTWEHLKIAVIPTLLWAFIALFLGYNNFNFGVFIALLTILLVIPSVFYGYTYKTKKPILIIDIVTFFVAIALAVVFMSLIFTAGPFGSVFNVIGVVGNLLIIAAFAFFTYNPPKMFLFKDPITGKYGLEAIGQEHKEKVE